VSSSAGTSDRNESAAATKRLLNFVLWVCGEMVEAVKWIDSKVPDVRD